VIKVKVKTKNRSQQIKQKKCGNNKKKTKNEIVKEAENNKKENKKEKLGSNIVVDGNLYLKKTQYKTIKIK
jgi:predicted RND superfamily exporter protein